MVGKFAGSRSVTQAVVSSSEEVPAQTEFRAVLQKFDLGAIRPYSRRLRGDSKPLETITKIDSQCSFEITQYLTDMTWGRQITGVTMPAAHEQVTLSRWNTCLHPLSAISVLVDKDTNKCHTRGAHRPYIGSRNGGNAHLWRSSEHTAHQSP